MKVVYKSAYEKLRDIMREHQSNNTYKDIAYVEITRSEYVDLTRTDGWSLPYNGDTFSLTIFGMPIKVVG
jgi:hypothetical protein